MLAGHCCEGTVALIWESECTCDYEFACYYDLCFLATLDYYVNCFTYGKIYHVRRPFANGKIR